MSFELMMAEYGIWKVGMDLVVWGNVVVESGLESY